MLTNFNSLPDDSRVWIYQANRKLSDQEVEDIQKETEDFLTQWTAHGAALEAAVEMKYNRFIVIGINQNNVSASGCSIDASVRFIQSLEEKYKVDLLDKMNVTFYTGEFITHKPLTEFRTMAKNKAINANTVVFNNLVNTKEEYLENWEVPAHQSWHSRFLS
ncbi:MAG TPA: ABC transporter ATPase [Flavobacteriaceae bacterium]|nr:ABC transporter ATPase [Flavobacteriaceae bacterium]